MNEFTGERVVPGQVNTDLWNEHFSRYAFAARFARGARVLDLGCGTGYGSAELAQHAAAVTGVDIAEDAVEYARSHFRRPNLNFIRSSCTQLDLPAGAFDLITAFEVIEHLPNGADLIREAGRVLRPGGLFVVSTPNKLYYAESRKTEGPNPFHEHEYELTEFAAELGQTFPQVSVLLQNRTECLAFYPPKTFWPAQARIDATGGAPADAHFFLAVCSHSPITEQRSFAYVPKASNLVWEREQHIVKLTGELALNQQWQAELRGERETLLKNFQEQQAHLEEHNRWALQLEQEWRAAQARIVELQQQYQTEQEAALELARAYDARIRDLEQESQDKTAWALETERRLTGEIEHERARHLETLQRLETTEATLDERTRWALDLQSRLGELEAQLNAVRSSRWVSLGRKFGAGPRL